MQCAEFLPHDTSLTTLALAEQACSTNPNCTAVSDLYCNGMFNDADHYALCRGGNHVSSTLACLWSKPAGLTCTETCAYSSDGDCDDGGAGSEYFG